MDIYENLLKQESLRGERTAWVFRWGLYGVAFLLSAVVFFIQGRIVGFYGILLSIGAMIYNVFLTRSILRKRTGSGICYTSVTIDILSITIYNTLDTIFTSSLVPVTTATLMLYPLLIFLASLRLDRRLIIYATLFSALCMNVLYGFAYPHFDQDMASRLVSADILGQLYRTVYLMVCGWLMLFIPGTMTRLLKKQRDMYEKNRDNYEMAHRDNLTGLANRRLLDEYLPVQMVRSSVEHLCVGLLFLDLDGFKPVNDTYGHDMGDLVLIEVGKRLQAAVRDDDLVARIGGDEFVIVLSRIEGKKPCQSLAQRIKSHFAESMYFNEKAITIGVSIGIAVYPDEANTALELISKADKAMLKEKKNKR